MQNCVIKDVSERGETGPSHRLFQEELVHLGVLETLTSLRGPRRVKDVCWCLWSSTPAPRGWHLFGGPISHPGNFFTPSPLPQDGQEGLSGWWSRRREVEAHRMWDLSSPTRDGNQLPCIGGQSPNHWTTGKIPKLSVSQLRGSFNRKGDFVGKSRQLKMALKNM